MPFPMNQSPKLPPEEGGRLGEGTSKGHWTEVISRCFKKATHPSWVMGGHPDCQVLGKSLQRAKEGEIRGGRQRGGEDEGGKYEQMFVHRTGEKLPCRNGEIVTVVSDSVMYNCIYKVLSNKLSEMLMSGAEPIVQGLKKKIDI